MILTDLDSTDQLKLLKLKSLRSADSNGQYTVKEALACISESAAFSLEQMMVDLNAPGKSKVAGILAGLERTTVLTAAPTTEILIDRIMALLGQDREGQVTTTAATLDANTRIQDTRFLLSPKQTDMTAMSKTFTDITMAFPLVMGCSEVLEGGKTALAASPALIAESIQVGKTIIACAMTDTKRAVRASNYTEAQKEKILTFARSVEIKIPRNLQALASMDGVKPLVPGKLQGLAGDIIYIFRDIWSEIRKSEELIESYTGTKFMGGGKDTPREPREPWKPKGDKRKGEAGTEAQPAQPPSNKVFLKREKVVTVESTDDKDPVSSETPKLPKRKVGKCPGCNSTCIWHRKIVLQTVFNTGLLVIIQNTIVKHTVHQTNVLRGQSGVNKTTRVLSKLSNSDLGWMRTK